ncbi:glucose 1-dehydrogenase [Frankia sp. CNm7]|uniref:Glucose 1-dehydrogenase n=1 Tax=Frankia nepalensis TaxID=1836974 RepID=A0A937RTW3_9ACTN|nr:SDR family oxidoreductase [Frankia nepalensis]MBL7499420.1 glucose 1-dehydrogenase [Frankia nepalensis]MBL7515442.1 glucose 1-dehydrogenase [Frankia nepalensis]MBL7518400.1 glucose 1-dehydrogenase [Frankia nepalensis]MBL7631826.1 glucose 1-dehydrogenase [Frankia nepalensis]
MAAPRPLEGSTALVTGGGSGIGLAVAKKLAADGSNVLICGRTESRLTDAAKQLEAVAAAGAEIRYVVADVTVEDDVAGAVDAACAITGGLDAVVAVAGGNTAMGPLTQIDVAKWRETMDLNVTGTLLAIKYGARPMARAGRGSIVGVSSIAASNTHRWFGPYGVSKAGVDHLCQLAADELGASGVRVNCVRPGLIRTDLVEAIFTTPEVLEDYRRCTPLGRPGEPEEVADLIRFLVGPESRWLTGQVINIDGGHCLRRGPDFSPLLGPLFGADGLRGLVAEKG